MINQSYVVRWSQQSGLGKFLVLKLTLFHKIGEKIRFRACP